MNRRDLLATLADYRVRHSEEIAVVERFCTLLRDEPRCFERNCFAPGHITGSAWLLNRGETHVLLTHHRKLGRWLQLGGHADGDEDVLAVATREAREESSLEVAPVSLDVFDIDVHEIPARGDDPRHLHFDVRFALKTTADETFRVGPESHALRWVPLERISTLTDEASIQRMARKWRLFAAP
jgi:8-oxo-dGTP pyrophosphatase MutT (NUDIX family)